MGKPSQARLDALRTTALAGDDSDLPDPRDRRNRGPEIVDGQPLVVGTDLTVGRVAVTVIAPGRLRTTFVAAWLDDSAAGPDTQECYGTFFVSQIDP